MGNHLNLDYLPPSYRDTLDIGEIILRDGTTAKVHPAQPKDQADLSSFFDKLSAESRCRVFFFRHTPSTGIGDIVLQKPRPAIISDSHRDQDTRLQGMHHCNRVLFCKGRSRGRSHFCGR